MNHFAKYRATMAGALMLLIAPNVSAQDNADDPNDGKLIACGADKVVLFADATSPDGRYAAGWTLRQLDPKAKRVDWSKWDAGKPYDFLDNYDYLDPEVTGSGMAPLVDAAKSSLAEPGKAATPYELFDCVVDLKKKTLLPLRSSWPYWPNKNHGDFNVVWHRGADGAEYAVVFNEARWFTEDVWLVKAQESGMRAASLADPLNAEVARVLKTKRPLAYEAYAVSFSPNPNDNVTISFTKTAAVLGFNCEIPKIGYENVDGKVTVDLESGKIIKTNSDTRRDDPFLDNPALAKADNELNEVYAALMAKLSGARRGKLREEQRYWLANRDYAGPSDAGSNLSASVIEFQTDHLSAVPDLGAEEEDAAFNKKRDESLIRSTRARTAVLKKQLATGGSQAASANSH